MKKNIFFNVSKMREKYFKNISKNSTNISSITKYEEVHLNLLQ